MGVARVQARGQVTVPRDIREACDVEPGTDLYFVKNGPDSFECRVLPTAPSIAAITAEYAMDGVAPDLAQLREEMGTAIAERLLSRVERS